VTGAAGTASGRDARRIHAVVIVPQREEKVNTRELMHDLEAILQNLEDTKTVIMEQQEEIREMITELKMAEVAR
jgi:hypothetical protein